MSEKPLKPHLRSLEPFPADLRFDDEMVVPDQHSLATLAHRSIISDRIEWVSLPAMAEGTVITRLLLHRFPRRLPSSRSRLSRSYCCKTEKATGSWLGARC